MLRISQGKYKNKNIKVPRSARPVRERIRHSVFSILEPDRFQNATVLDLFAGSGILGIESLSIGAEKCTFIDSEPDAVNFIKENITDLNVDDPKKIIVLRDEAVKYILDADTGTNYDIIFADPPYDSTNTHVIKNIDTILNDKGIIVYFSDPNRKIDFEKINKNLKVEDSRIYGATKVDFIRKK